jgi:hypothetical protein
MRLHAAPPQRYYVAHPLDLTEDAPTDSAYVSFKTFYNLIQTTMEGLYLKGLQRICGVLGKAKGKVLELAVVIHLVEHWLKVGTCRCCCLSWAFARTSSRSTDARCTGQCCVQQASAAH